MVLGEYDVLKAEHEAQRDATEWMYDCKGEEAAEAVYYIGGIIDVCAKILRNFKKDDAER